VTQLVAFRGSLSEIRLNPAFDENSKNALACPWWVAELTRNGADYSPTVRALSNSQFARSWQHLDVLRHRPAALAVVGFMDRFGSRGATDEQAAMMPKAFNLDWPQNWFLECFRNGSDTNLAQNSAAPERPDLGAGLAPT
jgi:hypothetical protein